MDKEQFKSGLLVVLLIMCLVLVQNIWFNIPLKQLQIVSVEENQLRIQKMREKIIAPRRAIVNFDKGTKNSYFAVLQYEKRIEAWENSKIILDEFFNGNTEINAVLGEEYLKNRRGAFIELEFGGSIPSVLVSSIFESANNNIVEQIKKIEKIVLPVFSMGNIYIYDDEGNIFEVTLRIYTDNDSLSRLVSEIEKGDFVKHYTLFSFVDNDVIMPLNYDISLERVFVENKIDIKDENKIRQIAQSFFNENFDFVRMIKETSGAVVYLYGFSEKTVRINPQGRLTYRKDIGNTFSSSVVEALDVAMNFMEKQKHLPKNIYLEEVKSIDHEGNRGYFFGFNYRIGEYPIYFSEGGMNYSIEIEVFGNTISSYDALIRKKMDVPAFIKRETIMPPHVVIERNIQLFKERYAHKNGLEIADIENADVLKSIISVEMVYYDTKEMRERQVLNPSWKMVTSGRTYFFDSYRGNLISERLNN
ncbi:MAG: two-component system activity regulator YycH [Alkaliphilus sp.]